MDAVTFARLIYVRAGWMASKPCDRCQPGQPCADALRVMLLTDALSIALDLAVAEASIERTRAQVAWG